MANQQQRGFGSLITPNGGDQLTRRLGAKRHRWPPLAAAVVAAVGGVVLVVALNRCSNGSCSRSADATKAAAPAQIAITPGPGAHDVDPVAPVMVKADSGTLTDVQMVNENGKSIQGVMTPDNTVWKPTVPLGYGHTYTLTVTSRGPNGVAGKQVSSFSTLQPSNQTKVSFTTTSEAALHDGGTYGVGTVVVAHFDERITDRAAAERQLTVTTNPKVEGFVVLDRRPKRPLATGALLRTGHDG